MIGVKRRKRIGAALLAAVLVLSQLGATAYAEGNPAGAGLCEHHRAHDGDCGYVEAVKGHACEHEHGPECYTDELICGMDEDAEQDATASDAGHTHNDGCYKLDCQHKHDDACGYIEAVKGQPCGYVCEVCAGEPDKDSGNDLTPPEKTGPETVSPEGAETVTVTAFDGLSEAVRFQTVPAGTALTDLSLPAALGASGRTADGDPEAITITGVTWEPDSPWDETAEQGGYTFTPVLPAGYTLADGVEPPEIDVLIGGAITLDLQGNVLTVTFDDNGTGGTDDDNNEMQAAIDAALAALPSGSDKTTITTIKLTGGVTEITDWNWRYLIDQYYKDSGWASLTALDLSDMGSLTAIRNDTGGYRGGNTKLQTLELPDGLEQIGDFAFYDCSNLTLTELPAKITQIGWSAFSGCTGLALQALPAKITQIGDSAFFDCTGLALQKLPADLAQIGRMAFYGCTGLAHLTIPASVTSIGDAAFRGCTNLKSVTFEGSTVPTIGNGVFANITPQPAVYVPDGATGNYPSGLNPRPVSQKGILTVAFDSNGSGGTDADNNDMRTAIDAALLTDGQPKEVIEKIVLTGDVTEITGYNWKYLIDQYQDTPGWASLTALDLSGMAHLTTVKNDTNFTNGNLTKLRTLALPDTMTEIGRKAFQYCWNLTLTELPKKLTQIGVLAFDGCTGLALTELPADLTQIGESAFYGCTGLALKELPTDLTQIGDSAFSGCTRLALQELPAKLTQIGDDAFLNCTSLALTELPAKLTQIGKYAFQNCTNLALQELPDGLTRIGNSAFSGCTGLTLTELPADLTQIGTGAFSGCTGLALKELPDGLTQIEAGAFSGCTEITLSALPDGVTEIGRYAFEGCTGLEKIVMSRTTAPTIYDETFRNTSAGLTFYVPKGSTDYDKGVWAGLNPVPYSPTTSLTLDPELELQLPGGRKLTATLEPDDAVPIVLWESSDTNIATVDKDGNVTAVAVGTATITATSLQGGKTATCTVNVETAPPATIPVTGVTLDKPAYILHTDKDPRSFQLTATVEPANASDKTVSWASSAPGVATVDKDGNVTAVSKGTATITVTTNDGGKAASCTVTVETDSGGGGTSGGTSSSGGGTSRNYIITAPEPPKPDNPVLAVIELPVSVTEGKPATGAADDGRTSAALAEAGGDAKAKTNGIAVQYDAKTSLIYDGFSIVMQRATLNRLIDVKVKYVTLNTGIVDMTFDLAALQEIQKQATGDITLTAARETGLTGDALAAVGSRPAYRLSVGYTGADGKAATVDSFGAGRAAVGLAYQPAATEQTGSLYLVYSADGKGAEWLYQSSYDKNSGNVIGSVGHFSVYGVGYQTAPAFTDTANHWAKAEIDFVVSRGLFSGTSETTFSPDSTITRGMFVTALGRLAGIGPAGYPSSSRFTDVPATAYYAPFVEWAASKGIVTGTGESSFSPDAAITREQMALIMRQYADKLGYTLPVAREAVTFTDDNQITGSMKDAVRAIQQAGIMSGKENNRFGPKDAATRAEAAVVLRRFVEVVIDRDTAGGWGQNDAGRWLYYLDGKPVTGWKQIEGKWYCFDAAGLMEYGGWKQIGGKWYYFDVNGVMAVNTKVDGYEIGPDGARKEEN